MGFFMLKLIRTNVYIDGFNLYYNLFRGLRNTENWAFKWLDLESLANSVLTKKYKKNIILSTKYYTAHVSGAQDPTKPHRQNAYLRGLLLHSKNLEIIYGKFLIEEGYRPRVDSKELIKVYLPEEKGSDVNLSVHLVFEATQNLFDVAVIKTNDTDMTEAFRIVSKELKKTIILIQPEHV